MTPRFMLDTNIVSYLLRGRHPVLENHLRRHPVHEICISAITRAELRYGVARLPQAARLGHEVDRFLRGVTVLAWGDAAADAYGIVRAILEGKGQPIGALDTMIAAHALVADTTLVSNNLREFQRVPGLRLDNWAEL
ncbi:type II toxin-antitoxin system VapC family toxin [Pollutimonas bauzanensis]|uniref:Ribonuclease VapC n=1 Tax=Pollutimonas bauzanensis TaxID=658167 RepID=A0A1M5UL07_9BURK|nr:type II toxin-antitoxin system VapC family toxin [Pollutimonas bauzanensis]SHH63580.1 tRNA(fMet)-specific endonuclease VapC [Pollutimonas bauzanensis]